MGSPSLSTTTKAAPRSSSFVVLSPLTTQASRILSSFSMLTFSYDATSISRGDHDE